MQAKASTVSNEEQAFSNFYVAISEKLMSFDPMDRDIDFFDTEK